MQVRDQGWSSCCPPTSAVIYSHQSAGVLSLHFFTRIINGVLKPVLFWVFFLPTEYVSQDRVFVNAFLSLYY